MTISDASLELAIKNIAVFGDTDVFPTPLEVHWFRDRQNDVVSLLQKLRDDGRSATTWLPIFCSMELTNTGHRGYRRATQIEPLWNAYLLAACIEIAPRIEQHRQNANCVFSYRFQPDADRGSLFSRLGWREFHSAGLSHAEGCSTVAVVDISEFYARIYHHRLENVLAAVCRCEGTIVKEIDWILRKLNGGNSFGLPVGGPAARILAEAVLIRTDQLLKTHGIRFVRFVDDYILFGDSDDDVQFSILQLSRILLDSEGMSLNHGKSRIYDSSWYRKEGSVFAVGNNDLQEAESRKRRFYSLHLRYDPYSATAEEDYETLREAIEEFDVAGLLVKEVKRDKINIYTVRQLVKSLRFMNNNMRSQMIRTLALNLERLAPVFPTVARTFHLLADELSIEDRTVFFSAIRALVTERLPLIAATGTLAFAVRLLSMDPDPLAETTLQRIFKTPDRTPIIEREVVVAMTRRRANSWLSDLRSRFASINSPWTRRALLAGSFALGDEGKHWRRSIKSDLDEHDQLFMSWIADKNNGVEWQIPFD